MMRLLVTLFIAIALISPLYAQTELLSEDFEGPAPGTPLNSLGWIGGDLMVISDTLVDQGQSVGYPGGTTDDWPSASKMFDYTPGAEDQYVFTGTLWSAASTGGNYAHAQLRDSSSSAVVGKSRLHINAGYNGLTFGYILADGSYGDYIQITPQELTPVDFKAVITGSSFDAYWRLNGESEWTYAGNSAIDGAYGDGGIDMADFDTVDLVGHGGGLDAGIDTIRLMALPPDALPGDANRDGTVDAADAALLALNWQTLTGATWGMGDFNEDGAVNDEDATILAVNWQTGVAQAAVPEPGTIALLFLGGLPLLLTVRKRFA